MQCLVWLIVGFSAAVILPNEVGTHALPALERKSVAANAAGITSPLLADTDAHRWAWQQNANAPQAITNASALQRGDFRAVRGQLSRLQV